MSSLLVSIQAESACLEKLLVVLEQEDQALISGQFMDLPAITEQKTRLLTSMAQIDGQREAAQTLLGASAGHCGMDAAVLGEHGLSAAWSQLLALADRARLLNRAVAAKVYTHLDFTENALAYLQSGSRPLYGPAGQRKGRSRGARLAEG